MRIGLLLASALMLPSLAAAQAKVVPLEAGSWTATDSLRFGIYLGRPSVYINRGIALADGVNLRNGTLDFDMATAPKSENMGIAFRARDADHYEALLFRVHESGTELALQYSPGLNSLAVAWQVFFGDGASATIEVPRLRWRHVSLHLTGDTAQVYLDGAKTPALTVPHLVLGQDGGGKIGIWAGAFGTGVYLSNIRYTVDATLHPIPIIPLPAGTLTEWRLSEAIDASAQTPGTLPDLATLHWDSVRAEVPGLVLINRYRRAPTIGAPDNVDSILAGRVAGSKVVYARTTVTADRDEFRKLAVGFSDGLVVYCNGAPLYSGMHPSGLNNDLGILHPVGDAVYLPLRKGQNEIVFAVTEFFGGWAFSARWEK